MPTCSRFLPLVLLVASCLTLSSALAVDLPAKERIVILFSIDGFPAWMWKDPALPMPNLQRLAREGAVAEGMTVSNPSITWINHTTLITGVSPRKHGVLYNGLLVRSGEDLPPHVEPWRDRKEMVFAPTLYDATTRAGLTSAEVDWVAVTNPGTITWAFPELPQADQEIPGELVAADVLTQEQLGWFKTKNSAWRDMIWTKAACHLVEKKKPNLLLFHLLNTDAINHGVGPGTYASYTAYAYADRLLGDLLASIEAAGLKEKATIVITTDHGFKKVKKVVLPNVALREAGLLKVSGAKVTSCNAYAMAQGGMAMVYVTDPAKREELLPQLRKMCAELEGVASVHDGNEGPKFGMPTPKENQGMGDLILFAKASYAFQAGADKPQPVEATTNYLGTHGYPNSDPELDGVFIASGYGIKPGAQLGRMTNLDVAPTLAKLLQVDLPNVEGRVLDEILAK